MRDAAGLHAVIEAMVAWEFLQRNADVSEEEALGLARSLLQEHAAEVITSASVLALLREARGR